MISGVAFVQRNGVQAAWRQSPAILPRWSQPTPFVAPMPVPASRSALVKPRPRAIRQSHCWF